MKKSILMFCTLMFVISISNNCEEIRELEEKDNVERVADEVEDDVERTAEEVEGAVDDAKEELDGVR